MCQAKNKSSGQKPGTSEANESQPDGEESQKEKQQAKRARRGRSLSSQGFQKKIEEGS